MKTLESKIQSVTVFNDRAEVSRVAQVDLPIGSHALIFDKLPTSIQGKSIQVSGQGAAVLSNVKFKKAYFDKTPDETLEQLEKEKRGIEDNIQNFQDQLLRLEKEKDFIEKIADKVTHPESKAESSLDWEKWLKMIEFQQEKLSAADGKIRETEREIRQWQAKLNRVSAEIKNLGTYGRISRNQVEVWVEMPQEGSIQLKLSYVVSNAGWHPYYDIRVSTESKKMNIRYNAFIQQNTGEAWEDIQLKLSTAQPNISGQPPELKPWRIQLLHPLPSPSPSTGLASKARSMSNMMKKKDVVGSAMMEESAEEPYAELKPQSASVETKATSVFFQIAGLHSIKSDFTEHQVNILIEDFEAHFRYSAVPKLSPYAYLKAKVKNESPFPFLAGETNIFLDNNFVANARMASVAPDEEFWTFLGIDEGMKVEHKFLKKYERKEGGFFSKKNRVFIYEYETIVTNHKKNTEEIVLWDQLPISQNEKIKVELIEPKYKEDTDKLKKNEYDYLEWYFLPKAGEKLEVPFKFSVEFPMDEKLSGLD